MAPPIPPWMEDWAWISTTHSFWWPSPVFGKPERGNKRGPRFIKCSPRTFFLNFKKREILFILRISNYIHVKTYNISICNTAIFCQQMCRNIKNYTALTSALLDKACTSPQCRRRCMTFMVRRWKYHIAHIREKNRKIWCPAMSLNYEIQRSKDSRWF